MVSERFAKEAHTELAGIYRKRHPKTSNRKAVSISNAFLWDTVIFSHVVWRISQETMAVIVVLGRQTDLEDFHYSFDRKENYVLEINPCCFLDGFFFGLLNFPPLLNSCLVRLMNVLHSSLLFERLILEKLKVGM